MRLLLLPALLAAAAAHAEELTSAPPPPPLDLSALPPKAEPQDALVPEITIKSGEDGARVEEYRENGRLLFVRVVPARGIPYTLIDADGDGEVDRPRPMSNEVLPVFYDIKLPRRRDPLAGEGQD
jgi:hypothetical protein